MNKEFTRFLPREGVKPLRDLVSYDDKHNQANGEDNRDGTSDNNSWNCGAEGPTGDPGIQALRARQSRAMLTTLMLSFGVPLLLGGDEMGRTQQGNNNAYCQDNEITWFDWAGADTALRDFTTGLIAFRRAHPVFRRRRFLAGAEAAELSWFTPAGTPMDGADWADENALAIALYLDGSDDPDRAEDGTWLLDDDFLVLVNAWWEPLEFVPPATRQQASWRIEVGTYDPAAPAAPQPRREAPAPTSPSAPGPSWCCPIRAAADRAAVGQAKLLPRTRTWCGCDRRAGPGGHLAGVGRLVRNVTPSRDLVLGLPNGRVAISLYHARAAARFATGVSWAWGRAVSPGFALARVRRLRAVLCLRSGYRTRIARREARWSFLLLWPRPW